MSIHVVFVCEGNICRSPMAQGVFTDMVERAGLAGHITVDSVGTSRWHAGESPHRGTRKVLRQHGITLDHSARQISRRDVRDADYLIAMDRGNLSGVWRMNPNGARIGLLLDYASGVDETEVPDPYYAGGFDRVYELVEAGCRGLLDHIRRQEGI
jgi:protein-tyrosine phosphatase